MTQFEYLAVLVSILIGLGIAELMISWGRLLQRRAQVRFSALHAFWSIFTLLIAVQYWWGFWNFRTVEDWSLGYLLILVLPGVSFVLLTSLLVPGRADSGHLNLQDLYYENALPFFLIAAGFLALLSIADTFVLGMPIGHTENLIRLVGIVTVTYVGWSTNRRLHVGLPIVASVLLALFLARGYML